MRFALELTAAETEEFFECLGMGAEALNGMMSAGVVQVPKKKIEAHLSVMSKVMDQVKSQISGSMSEMAKEGFELE